MWILGVFLNIWQAHRWLWHSLSVLFVSAQSLSTPGNTDVSLKEVLPKTWKLKENDEKEHRNRFRGKVYESVRVRLNIKYPEESTSGQRQLRLRGTIMKCHSLKRVFSCFLCHLSAPYFLVTVKSVKTQTSSRNKKKSSFSDYCDPDDWEATQTYVQTQHWAGCSSFA